jgi:thiamine-phosphate pyrophosphorylase
MIQLRAKDKDSKTFLALAMEMVYAIRPYPIPVIINDRVDIALLSGAHGVHLGQDDLPPDRVRSLMGPDKIVGFSTHNLDQLRQSKTLPVDYVGFGPIFATTSKEMADPIAGVTALKAAVEISTLPVVAIGGIHRENLQQIKATGVHAFAMIDALLSAGDVERNAREILDQWRK